MEEKLGRSKNSNNYNNKRRYEEEEEGSDESSSEEEDDVGELATKDLDTEISATLNALRSKDPRVYDPDVTFYSKFEEKDGEEGPKQEKPMTIRDYHRQNLLGGGAQGDDEENAPKTFVQEQADLKRSVVREMHAAVDGEEAVGEEEDGFLVPKEKKAVTSKEKAITEADVAEAEKDPENFLSNFLAARAWVPTQRSDLQPFESDDEEEDKRAEVFEEAYNFRFEDPNKLNETIVTHARDTTSKYSVRRDELSGRKKKREAERLRKEEEQKERDAERARLRKLKIEQLEEKVEKIKFAAGIKSSDITDDDWTRFLDEKWDGDKWEEEMQKRFGNEYYEADEAGDSDGADSGQSKKRKPKKPTWDDDIDITDIVPDFDGEDGNEDEDGGEEDEAPESSKKGSKKAMLEEKKSKQREARRERKKIEQLVDHDLEMEATLLPGSKKKFSGTFRYRESSPTSYGLTTRDILMADDSQLNKYAGLKKLASFRDSEKKKRDNKRLGKKARLREWRKETFGHEAEPELPDVPREARTTAVGDAETQVDIREGGSKKRRKRSKKN